MVPPVIKGIQDQGVIANIKHFMVNNQETDRFYADVVVDERTRSIFLSLLYVSFFF